MLAEYRRLHSWLKDDTLARSWFRDQVLHPHETQHSLAELVPVLERCGMEIQSTSINRFGPVDAIETLFDLEKTMEQTGRNSLARGTYYPGFFHILAKKSTDVAA